MIALVLEDGVATLEVGPIASVDAHDDGLGDVIRAYYDDGTCEEIVRIAGTDRWQHGGRMYERVCMLPWPYTPGETL